MVGELCRMRSSGAVRPALLSRLALLATLILASDCLTRSCPRSLDCARAGRHFCPLGGTQCGPCLGPLVEDPHGRCMVRGRKAHHYAKKTTYPELDEEIDFLSTIVTEQRVTKSRKPASTPVQEAAVVKETLPLVVPSATYRPVATAAQAANQSTAAAPSALLLASNHTAGLSGAPVITPYVPNDNVFVVLSSTFIVAGSLALVAAGVCWVRLKRGVGLSQKVEYPAYGPMRGHAYDSSVPGDKKLAHSAQMYHYQHQRQQMLSLEKHRGEPKIPDYAATSDEETEDGDFTVYECPGLAPTGEMEVKNPLFDDSTLYLQRFPQ
ncbi:neural proliferation differentiation and control protein 1 [Gadus chalcogrammus]|uniref:neural proliferation differentiation and control protein 1 n=1 Tax=Gadus chalcogrammus TaxID=1042646 RepID=UPI0024C2E7B7|nr:neural proliferation differentiation and control protein 1 [Gadus chalcogrammus]